MAENISDSPWIELGIVSDPASGMAALVCIQHGQKHPLPSVQFGSLVEGQRFSPHVHPNVVWEGGKGGVDLESIGKIPDVLKRQIAELLRPHLVEGRSDAVKELLNYKLLETQKGSSIVAAASCLRCS